MQSQKHENVVQGILRKMRLEKALADRKKNEEAIRRQYLADTANLGDYQLKDITENIAMKDFARDNNEIEEVLI